MGIRTLNLSAAEDLESWPMPTRPDGTYYRFEMLSRNGWDRSYADTAAELLDLLIDGYSTRDTEARLAVRIKHAIDTQVIMQARINALEITPDTSAACIRILTGSRDKQPHVTEWDCEVPLVLIDAFYTPFTESPRPSSSLAPDTEDAPNLLWLRPAASEMDYLLSLHEVGAISLSIASDEVA